MKLYKFRPLRNNDIIKDSDLDRIKDIIDKGFYCCDFLNFNDMNEGVFSINLENEDITLDLKQKYKICSFSGQKALNSQLMWGHYANAGMGVAIEIEVKDKDYSDIKKVVYSDNKKVVYSDNYNKLDSIEKILTHKTTEWQYENEFRYIKKTSKETIKIGKITKIYFGTPYEGLTNYKDIKDKHTKLQEYLELKEELEQHIKGTNSERENKICCKNYEFNF